MKLTIIALVCCLLGTALAYPYPDPDQDQEHQQRLQQRLQVEGGYNSDKNGRDFQIQGQIPVWTSENKRHEVDVAGHYGQHFGGPYGKSEPSWGAGPVYRFRF